MVELDFSKLENIAYRGVNGAEARAEKDALIEQGFTVIEGEITPFDAPEAATPISPSPAPLEATKKAFTDASGKRSYKTLYRAAHDFHERNNPPTVDREYWKSHNPGIDEPPPAEIEYWQRVAADLNATASSLQQDPFFTGLLMAIFEELEREYKAIKSAIIHLDR